tara:strand:+ start:704 stop:820 length:117 start_codon:yes stop_codon:yes gene_type:complete
MHPEADMSIVGMILTAIVIVGVFVVPVLISYIKEKIKN